jgi:hypothetical protein
MSSSVDAAPPASRLEVDVKGAVEAVYEQGWSDGLPGVPPTPELVEEMLAGRDPAVVLGTIPPVGGIASREKVAAAAVMAGCRPEYFAVLEAIVKAACEPTFNLAGIQPTTHVAAPLAIVSGPIVEEIGLNSKAGVFGPGNRANATLGRAFALVLWNLGGARPGISDMSQFGNPARYGCVIGERRDVSSWAPLQTVNGVDAELSAVTMVAAEAPKSVVASRDPRSILGTLADCMRTLAAANMHLQGQMLAILGPEHARALDGAGIGRAEAQRRLHELARRPVRDFRTVATYGDEVWRRFWPAEIDLADDDAMVPVARRPEDILLSIAGGDVGRFSVCCPGWGSGSRAVSVAIEGGS